MLLNTYSITGYNYMNHFGEYLRIVRWEVMLFFDSFLTSRSPSRLLPSR